MPGVVGRWRLWVQPEGTRFRICYLWSRLAESEGVCLSLDNVRRHVVRGSFEGELHGVRQSGSPGVLGKAKRKRRSKNREVRVSLERFLCPWQRFLTLDVVLGSLSAQRSWTVGQRVGDWLKDASPRSFRGNFRPQFWSLISRLGRVRHLNATAGMEEPPLPIGEVLQPVDWD